MASEYTLPAYCSIKTSKHHKASRSVICGHPITDSRPFSAKNGSNDQHTHYVQSLTHAVFSHSFDGSCESNTRSPVVTDWKQATWKRGDFFANRLLKSCRRPNGGGDRLRERRITADSCLHRPFPLEQLLPPDPLAVIAVPNFEPTGGLNRQAANRQLTLGIDDDLEVSDEA